MCLASQCFAVWTFCLRVLANEINVGKQTHRPCGCLLRNSKPHVPIPKWYPTAILTAALQINHGMGCIHRPQLTEAGHGSCSFQGQDSETAGVWVAAVAHSYPVSTWWCPLGRQARITAYSVRPRSNHCVYFNSFSLPKPPLKKLRHREAWGSAKIHTALMITLSS